MNKENIENKESKEVAEVKEKKLKESGRRNPLYAIDKLIEIISAYTNKKIKNKEYPILYECLIEKGLNPKYVNEINRQEKLKNNFLLDDTIAVLIMWQEVILEKMLITCNGSPAGVIFKLKQSQHGWTDKTDINQNIDMNIDINIKFQ